MVSTNKSIIFAILALATSPYLRAEVLELGLSGRVRTCIERKALADGFIRVGVPNLLSPVEANFRQGSFTFSHLFADGALVENIEVEISPPAGFVERTIRIRRRSTEHKILKRALTASVVRMDVDRSYKGLERFKKLLEAEHFDEALAYFEFAYQRCEGIDRMRDYVVKLLYNYARALQQTCIHHHYATCSAAKNRYLELNRLRSQHLKLFQSEGLTEERILEDIRDIDFYLKQEEVKGVTAQYTGVEEAYRRGLRGEPDGFLAAARTIDGILADYQGNQAVWVANGRPRVALSADGGKAYLNYVLTSDVQPEDARELLTRSAELLRTAISLGDKAQDTAYAYAQVQRSMEGEGFGHQ